MNSAARNSSMPTMPALAKDGCRWFGSSGSGALELLSKAMMRIALENGQSAARARAAARKCGRASGRLLNLNLPAAGPRVVRLVLFAVQHRDPDEDAHEEQPRDQAQRVGRAVAPQVHEEERNHPRLGQRHAEPH